MSQLSDRTIHATIEGHPLSFERRRYGRTTFTWVYWWTGTEWKGLGDPWPCINPAKKEILATISAYKGVAA